MKSLRELLAEEPAVKQLLPSTIENITRVYESSDTPEWGRKSIEELLAGGEWTELNDRFYKKLAFGTGGIRGRTIGRKVTKAELGTPQELGRPEFAAIGSNVFNAMNVRRAAQGTGQYLLKYFKGQHIKGVVSHDTRHFSRFFAELVAKTWSDMGIEVYLFPEDRSTPQLSFSVRWLKAHVGVMITASHNPSHDNGYKAYFADGGQLVEPHATGVIAEVNALDEHPLPPYTGTPGPIHILDAKADKAYADAVSSLVIEPKNIEAAKGKLKIVYTPVHGTGRRIIPSLLKDWGFDFSVVAKQDQADGRFPTVKSPNPENAEALQLGVDQAKAEGADIVLATDPDADRMGVVARNAKGEYEIITGNMIGSIMAAYRTEQFFAKGLLNDSNKKHATLIKTFVTTDLQKNIADHFGIKCVNTLTGFKYIGEKLLEYEKTSGLANYDDQPVEVRRKAQLTQGTFFVFGGEESYGYSGGDYVRDKDANAAVLMFSEVAAYAKANGQTIIDYLDGVYRRFGYFTEKLGTLTFEGAAGAAQIQKLLKSYRENSPKQMNGSAVTQVDDFGLQDFKDIDGKEIPKETMLLFHLANGSRMVVRGSGTEPKIKFYFLTQAEVKGDLAAVKAERKEYLNKWWDEVQSDVKERVK
jgi:phosphoglucomutase